MRAVSLVALALIATTALAQPFVGANVDPSGISVTKNIPFHQSGGRQLHFDFYRPAGNDIVPVAITCNVGNPGMKDWDGYVGWGRAAADAGIAAVHYEAVQGEPAAIFDALVATLRARAAELRIDPSRVVLWAGSSNVSLALPLAMAGSREFIRGAVIYYGETGVEAIRHDLPLLYVKAGLDQPGLNQRIDSLVERALAANAPWTVINHASGVHGFDFFSDDIVSREIVDATLRFMVRVVEPELSAGFRAASRDAELAVAFNRGDWPAAATGYASLAAERPSDADVHLRLGTALFETGRPAEALEAYERAWLLGRRGPRDTGLPAARAAARSGNVERAIHWLDLVLATPFVGIDEVEGDPAFEAIRQSEPFSALLRDVQERKRISAMLREGKTREGLAALASFEGILREVDLNRMGYELLGAAAIEGAIGVFELATERHPDSPNAWDSLSEAYERAGNIEKSLHAARRALALDPPENVRAVSAERISRLSNP